MIITAARLAMAAKTSAVAAAVTVAALAGGVMLMLYASCVPTALAHRADRTAWLDSSYGTAAGTATSRGGATTTVIATSDYFGEHPITVVGVRGAGKAAPTPPGVRNLPAVDQSVVSPALARLIDANPELRLRYGPVVGLIGSAGLGSADELVVVRGVSAAQAALAGTTVTSFPTHSPIRTFSGILRLLLIVGTAGLVAPIVILVLMAGRLSTAARSRRLAALRLAGATATQVRGLAAAEGAVLGLIGTVAGAVLALAARPLATYASYDAGRWFPSDVTPAALSVAAVIAAVPILTAALA